MSSGTHSGMGQGSNPNPVHSIDRILASDEALAPSSGFLAAVMARVQEEAATPAPIPFPWKRAIPGIVLAACVLGWGAYECLRHVLQNAQQFSFALPHVPAAAESALVPAGWVVLALAASLLSWIYASRMARGTGLF
ncbi:MAG TPA: hypothetical protein VHD85_09290 [Terracidiphilus sp.]|nr:hypothetical protein [Terracidiphilus sp.]